jgi:hypothetical protein
VAAGVDRGPPHEQIAGRCRRCDWGRAQTAFVAHGRCGCNLAWRSPGSHNRGGAWPPRGRCPPRGARDGGSAMLIRVAAARLCLGRAHLHLNRATQQHSRCNSSSTSVATLKYVFFIILLDELQLNNVSNCNSNHYRVATEGVI